MKNFFLSLIVILLCSAKAIFALNYVENQLIIKLKQPLSVKALATAALNTDPILHKYTIKSITAPFKKSAYRSYLLNQKVDPLNNVYTITFAEAVNVPALIKEFRQVSQVTLAQPNFIYRASYMPNDTFYDLQWNIPLIKVDKAWDYAKGSKSIIVAVIDTGVDWLHEDLAKSIWINTGEIPDNGIDDDNNGYIDDYRGWNFVSAEPPAKDPMDTAGHGTAVSGVVGAIMDNNKGVAGVAQVSIMAVKTGDQDGSFFTDEASAGIVYAADNRANTLNLSWAGFADPLFDDSVLKEAVTYAQKKGCIVVAAAGNESTDIDANPVIPASYTGVYAISAVDNTGTFDASYSNFGNRIDFAAPGTDVPSTFFDSSHASYAYETGTSFAAPHVASLAGLILSVNPNANIYEALSKTATSKTGAKDKYYGYGLINGVKALAYAAPKAVQITHTPLTVVDKKKDIIVTANVTDVIYAEDTPTVLLYYAIDNTTWHSLSMKQTETNIFSGTIASTELTGTTLNYYIKAYGLNSANTVTAPDNAPTNYYSLVLEDLAGPVISSDTKTNDYVNVNDKIIFSIIDNAGVSPNTILLDVKTTDFSKTYNVNSPEVSFADPKLTLDLKKVGVKAGEGTFSLSAEDTLGNKSAPYELKVSLVNNPEELMLTGPSPSSPILNYPNPFNPNKENTKFCYMVNKDTNTTILIYSLNYQCVKRMSFDDTIGYHEVPWNGRDEGNDIVPTGIYILVIKVTSGGKSVTKYNKIAVVY